MYQTVIDGSKWGELFSGLLPGCTQTIAGEFLVTVGEHRVLGGIVAMQNWKEDIIFHSEWPVHIAFQSEEAA